MEGVAAIDEVRIEGEWGKLGFGEGRSNNTTTVLTTMKNGAKYSLSFWHLLNTMLFFFLVMLVLILRATEGFVLTSLIHAFNYLFTFLCKWQVTH